MADADDATDLLTLTRDGDVWVLTMTKADNRFNPRWAAAFSVALDRVEASPGPAALVITSSSPKFFSNGLDLDNLTVDELPVFVSGTFQPLVARLLEFPVPTVAALPGHAFAGGFMPVSYTHLTLPTKRIV